MKPAAFVVLSTLALTAASTRLVAQEPALPVQIPDSTPTVIPVGTRVGVPPTGYDDGGRRDPFTSLVAPKRTASPQTAATRSPKSGLAGVALADVTVRGITKTGTTMLAILEAPNKQSFIAHAKDRLLDGFIESIDAGGVVFADEATPGGRSTHMRKTLRPAGAGEDVR
jgi:hypothetical protein